MTTDPLGGRAGGAGADLQGGEEGPDVADAVGGGHALKGGVAVVLSHRAMG